MNALAKILGLVHEKYHICEQRMIWRGSTSAQSRHAHLRNLARAFADCAKKEGM